MSKERVTCSCGAEQHAYAFCKECGKELPESAQQRTSDSWEEHAANPLFVHLIALRQGGIKFCPICGENLRPAVGAGETVQGS